MYGLTFYADTLSSWLDQLSIFWDVLQKPVDLVLSEWAVGSGSFGPASILLNLVRVFISATFTQDLTVLQFIFSMMGVGFIGFFIFTIAKWVFGIITG